MLVFSLMMVTFFYAALFIPNGFRDLDSKIRIERPECTGEYMRTRESAIFENQILKGEGYIPKS